MWIKKLQKISFKKSYGYMVFLMCLLYLLNFLIESRFIQNIFGIIVFLVFLTSLLKANKLLSLFSSLMFLTGALVIFINGEGNDEFIRGIQTNVPVLAVMLLAPLLSIPFRLGGYFEPFQKYLLKIYKNPSKFFFVTTIFIFFVGPIMSIGVITVLHELIKGFKVKPELLAKSYLGGYSTVVIWSPYHSSVALVLYYLNVSVRDYLPLSLGLALLFLFTLNGLFLITKKNQSDLIKVKYAHKASKITHKNSLVKLLFLVILLICSLFTIEYITKWPMVFVVTLTAVVFPYIWSVFQRKFKDTREEYKNSIKELGVKANNEIILFISAGIFGIALKNASIMQHFQLLLGNVYDKSYIIFMVFIILIILVFTFIGIHQVVIVTALILQIEPNAMEASAEVLALLFMLSWSMSAVLSPVNPLNLVVSQLVNRSGLIIGAKQNGLYLLIMMLIGCSYVYTLHLFIDG